MNSASGSIRTRPAPGRSVATLRKVLAKRLPGYDPGDSALEARIARVIDAYGLPRPAQQHRVRLREAAVTESTSPGPTVVSTSRATASASTCCATDLDGDARRQNELVLDGWVPIEITWRHDRRRDREHDPPLPRPPTAAFVSCRPVCGARDVKRCGVWSGVCGLRAPSGGRGVVKRLGRVGAATVGRVSSQHFRAGVVIVVRHPNRA